MSSHLIRPIIYPAQPKYPGMGSEHRTLEELAAINDPRRYDAAYLEEVNDGQAQQGNQEGPTPEGERRR